MLERPDWGEKYPQEGKDSSDDTDHNCFSEAEDLGEHSSRNGACGDGTPDYPSHAGIHSSLNALRDNRLSQTHLVDVVDDDSNRRDKASHHPDESIKVKSERTEYGNRCG